MTKERNENKRAKVKKKKYTHTHTYIHIYTLKKITECDRNIGGLKGNCFLSSFVIKIYLCL